MTFDQRRKGAEGGSYGSGFQVCIQAQEADMGDRHSKNHKGRDGRAGVASYVPWYLFDPSQDTQLGGTYPSAGRQARQGATRGCARDLLAVCSETVASQTQTHGRVGRSAQDAIIESGLWPGGLLLAAGPLLNSDCLACWLHKEDASLWQGGQCFAYCVSAASLVPAYPRTMRPVVDYIQYYSHTLLPAPERGPVAVWPKRTAIKRILQVGPVVGPAR